MISWGISANSHNAALAVFDGNQIVFASESERFSKRKNDKHLCDELLAHARQWGDPDQVHWYENPYLKTARQLFAGQGWKFSDNNVKSYLARWNINAPIAYHGHHHSHAAAGYYTSGFDDACVIVLDTVGEFETLTIWQGSGNKLTKLYSKSFPNSAGLFYSAITQRLSLKPLEDEYVVMGMAAYGNSDRLFNRMRTDFVDSFEDFKFKQNLHRGCLDWAPDLIINDSFDIAAATQGIYEKFFEEVLHRATTLSKSKNLVLMGECALNCSANRLTGKYFDKTWIMPSPGDSGSAIGAVLAHKQRHITWAGPFLGYDMGHYSNNDDIVDYLITDKICGLARGKAEFGPRAFGNRSLIADPCGLEMKKRVNEIKQRQQFRPFAPAILEEVVGTYFDLPDGWSNSRYMQSVAKCKYPKLFPAVVHADGTSRIQTVPKDGSPFRQLLEKWYEKTSNPILLNTSLNVKGEPMVNDKFDALYFTATYGIKVFT